MSAAWSLYIRGSSKTAYFSKGDGTPNTLGTVTIDTGAGTTGKIGSNVLNMNQGSLSQHGLIYRGYRNFEAVQKFSVFMRVAFGTVSSANQLWSITGAAQDGATQSRHNGSGSLVTTAIDNTTGSTINTQTQAFTFTVGTFYDVGWTFDMSTTTNNMKLYVNGSLTGTTSSGATRTAPDPLMFMIMFGMQNTVAQNTCQLFLDEAGVYGDLLDFTASQSLVSGSGVLNGASRTSYLNVTAGNGDDTDPGIANVRLATTYKFGGSSLTGTAAIPGAANVRSGVATDATTGTVVVPTAANTKHGVAVDTASTGTYTGSDLWDAVTAAQLKHGVVVNQNGSSITGTYRGYDLFDSMTADLIKHGVVVNVDGTPITGTYRAADLWTALAASDVKLGVSALQDGTSFTGLYAASCDYPAATDVKQGVSYALGTLTGVYGYVPDGTHWPPTETQKRLFFVLGNDPTLVGLLGGTVYGSAPHGTPKIYDAGAVPDNTAYPYVTVHIKPWNDRGNHTNEGWLCELQIDVWYRGAGRGDAGVQAIQKRIDDLIHRTVPDVDGWNVLSLRRTLLDIFLDEDGVTKHGVQQFKLMIGDQ